MSHARVSSVEEIVMDETPAVQVTPTSKKTPITKKASGVKRTTIISKTSVLRRSSRIVSHAASKVHKGHSKETLTQIKSLDNAALFEKILRSKTDEPKIKKPGLTPEEIEGDMILMGITTASSSKIQAHPPTNLKSSMQQSSSLATPVASISHSKLPGTTYDEDQAKSLQPGKSSHCLKGCIKLWTGLTMIQCTLSPVLLTNFPPRQLAKTLTTNTSVRSSSSCWWPPGSAPED
jgi:hypothetical protein